MPRAREFEPDKALESAMLLFWQQGYDATSVSQLTSAMGINKFSLYDVFGDKKSLFIEALQTYSHEWARPRLRLLHDPGGREGILQFLSLMDQDRRRGNLRDGCLILNSLVEFVGRDDDVATAVRGHMKVVEDSFKMAVTGMVREGALPQDTDVTAKAHHIMTLIQGIIALSKSKATSRIAANALRHLRLNLGL